MLISLFTLQNSTLITTLQLFDMHVGLVASKIHRLVEYTPKKGFNSFVQSAVDARRQGDEKSNSSVVAEKLRLLANSSYDFQILDCSRHTVAKYLSDEKTHAVNNSKLFKKLDHVNSSLYEVELAKVQIEHKEPIFVKFFILQYAKLRILELYYNFFTKFCDVSIFEVLEMDADSWLLLRKNWKLYQTWKESGIVEVAIKWLCSLLHCWRCSMFLPQACCVKQKQHDRREPGLFKEEFRCSVRLYLCSRTTCCYEVTFNKLKFSSNGLNEHVWEQSGDGLLDMYRTVLKKKVNVTSNSRGFRANNHSVATCEQSKKSLSYCYLKRIAESDGIHTQLPNS